MVNSLPFDILMRAHPSHTTPFIEFIHTKNIIYIVALIPFSQKIWCLCIISFV